MKLSPTHLKRYKDIALLLWRYGRSDLVRQMGMDEAFGPDEDAPTDDAAEAAPDRLAHDLEAMGPTYVKLGQILSGRPDLLPARYMQALERLQDRVKPFAWAEVEEIVASELGVRISKAFSRFDPEPLAAGSLGQVHSAALRDGRLVVVKVQRPNIVKQITDDFEVLAEIAEFLDARTDVGRRYHFLDVLEEFRLTLRQELDYEREARNMIVVGENLREFPLIQIPQPVADYSTRRVLTMDYVRGRKITAVGPLGRMEMDGEPLAEQLFEAYLKQVLVDGLFHADPHPGNVFLTDGGHLALLDLGMVGHTTPAMQDHLFKVLMAISEGQSDEAAEVVLTMSRTTDAFNEDAFRRGLAQMMQAQQNQELSDINMGRALLELSRHAADNGLRVPSELTLLGKTLLQLSDVGKLLDPAFDANAAIRRHVGALMSRRMVKELSPGNMLQSLLEVKDLVTGLPRRLVKILEALGNRDLEVKVKSVDAPELIEGFRSIGNRITAGVVLAALIVGAALLMRVETTFRLWGYPGLAILCFLAAAAGGVWLLASIAAHDRPKRRKRPGTP